MTTKQSTRPLMQTGAQILIDSLITHGAQLAFGVPGESYLAVLDAIHEREEEFKFIICRQEGGVTNMAYAYGKLTGQPGIAFVTRGPGATNASVGVHTAFQDTTPMILFIGQVGNDVVEREAFQEIDYRRMYSECAKWVGSIDRVDRIDEFVSHAFHVAQAGRKGPVVLALPEDVLYMTGQENPVKAAHIVQPGLDLHSFDQAMAAFTSAKKPMVIAGGGNWNSAACEALRSWANAQAVPVASSFRSQDVIDNLDPAFAGDLGIGANPALVKRIQEADVLLVIG